MSRLHSLNLRLIGLKLWILYHWPIFWPVSFFSLHTGFHESQISDLEKESNWQTVNTRCRSFVKNCAPFKNMYVYAIFAQFSKILLMEFAEWFLWQNCFWKAGATIVKKWVCKLPGCSKIECAKTFIFVIWS